MAPKRAQVLAALIIAVALLASSCGGEERLSRSEYIAQGDAICTRTNEKFEQVFQDIPGPQAKPEQIQTFLTRVVPIVEEIITGFEGLSPPEDLQDEQDEAVAELRKARDAIREASEDPNKATTFFQQAEEQDPLERANVIAREVGFKVCGAEEEEEEAPAPIPGAKDVVIQGVEYAFTGLPSSLKAGGVNFVLDNKGVEEHQLNVGRLKKGVTAKEVIDTTKEEGFGPAQQLLEGEPRFVAEVGPGAKSDPGGLTLQAGSYILACFVEAPDGEPHAFKGMFTELKVT